MATTLAFVDSIVPFPGTRLDLGDGVTWRVAREGTDFPPPPTRRVNASRVDGEIEYDPREITLELTVDASTGDATATAIQALSRELDRRGGNILQVRMGTTEPVFFLTHRAAPRDVRMRLGPMDGKRRSVTVSLLAEPLAQGLRHDVVAGATLSSNPASANGCLLDVTGVQGDVQTSAMIRLPSSMLAANRETLIATRRRGSPSGAPFLQQAEALTQGTDTATQANDGNFSGAGNNYSRTTFATQTGMVTRLTLSDLGTASVDLRGRYRVWARVRKNTSGDTIDVRIQWGTSGGAVTTNATKRTVNTTNICYVDLGEIQIPRGLDPYFGRDGVELTVSDVYHLALQVQRVSGSGTFDVDLLLLVPSDDRLTIIKWVEAGPDHWWIDAGDPNLAQARNSAGDVATAAAPGFSGDGLPMLYPGQSNRIYIVPEVGSGLAAALTTATVSISYYPQYLDPFRPAAT